MYLEILNNDKEDIYTLLLKISQNESMLDKFLHLKEIVYKKSTKKYKIEDEGVLRLFIFDKNNNVIWKGLVPSKIKNNLVYENKKLSYLDLILPQEKNTSHNPEPQENNNFIYMKLLMLFFLIVIFIFIFLILKKK